MVPGPGTPNTSQPRSGLRCPHREHWGFAEACHGLQSGGSSVCLFNEKEGLFWLEEGRDAGLQNVAADEQKGADTHFSEAWSAASKLAVSPDTEPVARRAVPSSACLGWLC